MLMIPAVVVVSVIMILFILALSVLTVQKGYKYKHTIDPLPQKDEQKVSDDA